jgi:hypothetical protein
LCSFNATAADYDGVCMEAPTIAHQKSDSIVGVSSEPQLQEAMRSVSENTVIVIASGGYKLTRTLWVHTNNVTIRGDSNRYNDIVLVGKDIDGDTRGCSRGFTDVGAHEFGSDNSKC